MAFVRDKGMARLARLDTPGVQSHIIMHGIDRRPYSEIGLKDFREGLPATPGHSWWDHAHFHATPREICEGWSVGPRHP